MSTTMRGLQHGRPRKKLCPATGKKRHPDKRAAVRFLHMAVAAQRSEPPDGHETTHRERRAYFCGACQGWHLTSWTLEQFERQVRKVG